MLKADGSGTPSASNIGGPLHLDTYLGGRKKRKLRKEAPKTLYVFRPVLNSDDITGWAKSVGFLTVLTDLHATIAYSKEPVDWDLVGKSPNKQVIVTGGDRSLTRFKGGTSSATVLRFDSHELGERWRQIRDEGASWDYRDYKPHVTISYDAPPEAVLWEPYRGPIIFGPEEFEEVKDDPKADMVEKRDEEMAKDIEKLGARNSKKDLERIQAVHDHAVDLGASCHHGEDDDEDDIAKGDIGQYRLAKVDDSLGLVFGYAIICKARGKDYYDLNVDADTGKRVPEHVPESTMLKAASDFMLHSRVGNEMHSGPDKGTYVFAFPLTSDIAKAFGIETPVTGLLVGFKPPPDMLAKFKDGTYKGFSIEGRRIAVQEVD